VDWATAIGGAQTIADSVETVATLSGLESGSRPDMLGVNRLIAPRAGLYLATLTVHWGDIGQYYSLIRANGSIVLAEGSAQTSVFAGRQSVTGVVHMVAGDYVEALVRRSGGVNPVSLRLSLVRLG